ncbi:MAG TPA: cyclic nucleotide-binding domain-containing protein [Ilumatobacter sp.]
MTTTLPFPDEGRPPGRRSAARAAQVDHLARLPLFAGCSKRDLRHLARSTRIDLLEPDAALFSAGQPSREAYVIVAGRAVVRRNGRKVAELGSGDFVGELGLLLHRDHAATVTAVTSLEVLALPQQALREAIDEVPGLGWKLLQTVADRLGDPVGRSAR